jgi:outer membrane protein OmpU
MKKVLFATTALIATAGMAAAEVRLSGYGRFGIDYNDGNGMGRPTSGVDAAGNPIPAGLPRGQDTPETSITSRLRLQVDMTAETDGGVTFGARFRAQAESRDNRPGSGPVNIIDNNGDGTFDEIQAGGGATFNGARFYVTAAGFTLGVGNIIGAIENLPGLYLETRTAGIGIDGAGFESLVTNVNGESFNWDAYSSQGFGNNGVEALYSAGGFNGHISYSQGNDRFFSNGGGNTTLADVSEGVERLALNVSYTFFDAWTAALGYQDSNVAFEDKLVFTVSGDLGIFGVRFAYADNEGIDKYGLYGNIDIGAAGNLVAYVTDEGEVSSSDIADGRGDANADGTGYGVHYSYDLGGGVSFEAGVRESSRDNTTAQAGVYFSF